MQTIELSEKNGIATIWLNRSEVRNAFNALMIEELIAALDRLSADPATRIIVLRGKGKVFCSGADLNWMREAISGSREKNYSESLRLAECFDRIYKCPKPVVTVIHGAATGGATGFVAASDIAICADDTVFSLSEVRSGLVPAVISPYIIRRIGEFPAREMMLTAKRFYGKEAEERKLVNRSCPVEELDREMEDVTGMLLDGGPEALRITKSLIVDVSNNPGEDNSMEMTAGIIADIRVSPEAQEGMTAFLEKRKPKWSKRE